MCSVSTGEEGWSSWSVMLTFITWCLVEMISGSSQRTDCAGKVSTHTCRCTLMSLKSICTKRCRCFQEAKVWLKCFWMSFGCVCWCLSGTDLLLSLRGLNAARHSFHHLLVVAEHEIQKPAETNLVFMQHTWTWAVVLFFFLKLG